jgi:DNA-binding CsgD family transcriptional regulator
MPLPEGKTMMTSRQRSATVATAKSHLNKLFTKTGTARQADLAQRAESARPVSTYFTRARS